MFAFLFCEAPFCDDASEIVVNGEIFYFELIIDQILPMSLTIAQDSNFEFNIDQLKNSEFLR